MKTLTNLGTTTTALGFCLTPNVLTFCCVVACCICLVVEYFRDEATAE